MDTKEIALKIKQSMDSQSVSYGELSKRTGIPKSALFRYSNNETPKIPLDRLELIANALNVSARWLIGWENEAGTENSDFAFSPTVTEDYTTFPVIGEVAAGYDSIALEDWEGDTIEIPNSYLKGHSKDDFFVLRVKGSSMYPQYQNGDKVLVLKTPTLDKSGDIGVILYEDDYATLKKVEYVYGEDWLRLIPINPEYEPKLVEGEDLEHCRVIGIPKLLIREIGD